MSSDVPVAKKHPKVTCWQPTFNPAHLNLKVPKGIFHSNDIKEPFRAFLFFISIKDLLLSGVHGAKLQLLSESDFGHAVPCVVHKNRARKIK